MCGIVGFNWADAPLLANATEQLAHRGPDDQGLYTAPGLSLGHRRLSIIDLSQAGHQPMGYQRQTGACSERFRPELLPQAHYLVVFNGELYNYLSLRNELSILGYHFGTQTDTEVLLAAYAHWGTACVEHLSGMWAFALWDVSRQELFLARDPMGKKPLYYYLHEGRFAFASELKALAALPIRRSFATEHLPHYWALACMPAEGSVYRQIYKLRPGHRLLIDLAAGTSPGPEAYFRLSLREEKAPRGATQQLFALLDAAVQRRLLADVPVGAFLSGGVDSSAVVYLMRRHTQHLKTFSVGFDREAYNETRWSQQVARQLGTQHFEIRFGASDLETLIDRLPYFYDEPFADSSMIPTYLVSQVAATEVTVALSGTGADELFAGYPRLRQHLLLGRLQRLPKALRPVLYALYGRWAPEQAHKLPILMDTHQAAHRYLKLFSPQYRHADEPQFDEAYLQHFGPFWQPGPGMQAPLSFEQSFYLPEDLLVKEDRAGMAHGLETRHPFLDRQVVAFANQLPQNLKWRGNTPKYILKKAFEGHLPNNILYRTKQGFGVPLAEYFRHELRTVAEHWLFEAPIRTEAYPRDALHRLWTMHQQQRVDYSRLFWSVLMLNRWWQLWGHTTTD